MSENPLRQAVQRAREHRAEAIEEGKSLVGPLGIEHIVYTETRISRVPAERLAANGLLAVTSTAEGRVFAALAQQVLRTVRERGFRSIGVVAPTRESGGTLVAANLAIALARDPNQTVIAVDLDGESPRMASLFEIEAHRGLFDHLMDGATLSSILVHPEAVKRLVLLPNRARPRPVDLQEALGSRAMAELMGELADRYEARLSVYDLPPLLDRGDGLAILPKLDCAVLVLRQGLVTRDDIEESKRLLAGVPMVGVVVNDPGQEARGGGRR